MTRLAKVVYQARPGGRVNNEHAQIIGQEFEAIRRKEKQLTPALVVERARAEDSPLHGYFEWDDAAAAQEHRLRQARVLIRVVVVQYRTYRDEQMLVSAFVSDRASGDGRAYSSLAEIMSEEEMRLRAVRELFMWFYSRRNDAACYPELLPLVEALDAIAPEFEIRAREKVLATP